MQGDRQTHSASDSRPMELLSPPATSRAGDPWPRIAFQERATDGPTDSIYASGQTNMICGGQVVNKGVY